VAVWVPRAHVCAFHQAKKNLWNTLILHEVHVVSREWIDRFSWAIENKEEYEMK
jgi:hypothetical protein